MNRQKELFESYSNLAYNLAGLFAFAIHGDVLFCMALQALGAASFVYHFQKTKPIFLFDWWAMMFVVSILTGQIIGESWAWFAVIAWNVVYPYTIMGKFNVFFEVGLSVTPCLISIFLIKGFNDGLIVAAIFLFSVWIRSKDEDPKQLKFHDSVYHSLWHILTAGGFFIARYI